jgi:probable HAF family extracellular repeat protein
MRPEVVGTSEAAEGKLAAFLWQRGKMIDLNKAIPAGSGWLLLVASRINDRGEILGRGYLGGAIHAFLLEPEQASGKP